MNPPTNQDQAPQPQPQTPAPQQKRGLFNRLLNVQPPAQATPTQAPPTPIQAPQPAQNAQAQPPQPEQTLRSWNAPEFTFTQKPGGWYGLLALFFVALIVIAVVTKQWLSIAVFAVMGVAVAVMAGRKPRNLNYSITNYGIHVGEKQYEFSQFSAYFLADDYGQRVYELVPTKRFAPLVSIPAPKDGDDVEGDIAQILPKTAPQISVVEKLFKSLRF